VSADDTTLDAIAAQVRSLPPLPLDEVHALLDQVRHDGAVAARERLVEHHLRIA
jgi:DNA-directed RNA polymerase sigma subunit (sigma70/sigma32)